MICNVFRWLEWIFQLVIASIAELETVSPATKDFLDLGLEKA
jgi:hypothetical protein